MPEFLLMEWLGKPVWMWTAFLSLVVFLLAFDLGVLNRKDKELGVKESLLLSAFYIGIATIFGAYIWWSFETGLLVTEDGTHAGISYFTGFFIEKSLSIDNVFVISLIFSYFAIPAEIPVPGPRLGHRRRHRPARHHDRGGRCAGAGIRLDALSLRRLPHRDRHQDAARARERTEHRQERDGPLPAQAHAGDEPPSRSALLRARARSENGQDRHLGDAALPRPRGDQRR